MRYCKQHNEIIPCPQCAALPTAALIREAQEFALAYEVVSPEYQERFAKDAVALIRKLAKALAGALLKEQT